MNVKETIRKYSEEIGIEAIGFCKAEMDEQRLIIYEERKRAGWLCDLEVVEDLKNKINPHNHLVGAKTFIVMLQSYTLTEVPPIASGMGTLSQAANLIDYHTLIRGRLSLLKDFLSEQYGSASVVYCDQSPFSDRQVAYLAGLGVIGKNSFLIHQQFGSAFFIGYLLSDIAVEAYDEPQQVDYCTDCNICVDACPNEAILGNGQIHASRCISYLTQAKNIENSHKEAMGIALYGCDVCQMVCPCNKDLSNGVLEKVVPAQVDLNALLEIKNDAFKQTFGKTASGWRGKKMLQRNAIIALGNIKSLESVQLLAAHATDPREDIRREIVISLSRMHTEAAIEALNAMFKIEKNEAIVQMIRAALT